MIPIKLNIGSKKSYLLPQSWAEVSTFKFIQLQTAKKFSHVLAILASIDIEEVKSSDNLELDTQLYPYLKWYESPPEWEKMNPPKVVNVHGKSLYIPSDLGYSTFEQVENLKLLVAEEVEKQGTETFNFTNLIIPTVAAYLQPMYDDSVYDERRSKLFEEYVSDMSILEVYPLATFFLRKYSGLRALSKQDSKGLKMKIILIARKRILSLWKNLDFLEQSIIYRREILPASTQYSKQSGMSASTTGRMQSGRGNMKND